jgi:hypothetical protein
VAGLGSRGVTRRGFIKGVGAGILGPVCRILGFRRVLTASSREASGISVGVRNPRSSLIGTDA